MSRLSIGSAAAISSKTTSVDSPQPPAKGEKQKKEHSERSRLPFSAAVQFPREIREDRVLCRVYVWMFSLLYYV